MYKVSFVECMKSKRKKILLNTRNVKWDEVVDEDVPGVAAQQLRCTARFQVTSFCDRAYSDCMIV